MFRCFRDNENLKKVFWPYVHFNGRTDECMYGWMKELKKDGKMKTEGRRKEGGNERTNERRKE